MPEDYNPDADLEQAGASGGDSDESADSSETFLAPKSAFYGKDLKVGDKETVEVVAFYEDELELKCVKEGNSDDESSAEEQAAPPEEELQPDA